MINIEELKKLRESLPKDFASQIESKTGLSPSTIYKVIAGERNNTKIIDAAIDLAKEQKIKLELQKQAIGKL
jgi:hypothetical protein